jgi:hypothetical protein
MRTTTLTLTLTAAAILLTGCGSTDTNTPPAPSTDATPEERYLHRLHQRASEENIYLGNLDDDWLVDWGHAICEDIAGGAIPGDLADDLADNPGSMGAIAPIAVGTAQIYLCPPR